jgi:hypothetical protein
VSKWEFEHLLIKLFNILSTSQNKLAPFSL